MSSIVDTPYSTLSQPKSGWQLFKSLASGSLTPGLAWQNPAYRRK
ncbi:TPA: VirK/YbjX family protein, partial [Enterobacter hormaechei subsp. hoffmannii]